MYVISRDFSSERRVVWYFPPRLCSAVVGIAGAATWVCWLCPPAVLRCSGAKVGDLWLYSALVRCQPYFRSTQRPSLPCQPFTAPLPCQPFTAPLPCQPFTTTLPCQPFTAPLPCQPFTAPLPCQTFTAPLPVSPSPLHFPVSPSQLHFPVRPTSAPRNICLVR